MVAAGDPTNSADIIADEDYTIRRPLVRLVQAVAQSIPNNTNTALTFTTEDIDTNGFHDNVTNTSRITPTVAGYYLFTGTFVPSGTRTDFKTALVQIAKNGSGMASSNRWPFGGTSIASIYTFQCQVIASANGTTDYFEVLALLDVTGAVANPTSIGGATTSSFQAEFLRPL